jgi:hypothetical protein
MPDVLPTKLSRKIQCQFDSDKRAISFDLGNFRAACNDPEAAIWHLSIELRKTRKSGCHPRRRKKTQNRIIGPICPFLPRA